jgi:hypothetical protein
MSESKTAVDAAAQAFGRIKLALPYFVIAPNKE